MLLIQQIAGPIGCIVCITADRSYGGIPPRSVAPTGNAMMILAVGQDEALLVSRAAVLCKTTAEVMRAGPDGALGLLRQKRFDAIVLCHTLSIQESIDLANAAHGRGTLVVQVLPGSSSNQGYESIPADVLADADPERLVSQVAEVLHRTGTSAFPIFGAGVHEAKKYDDSL
jgi:hypothetical protein